jgi:hypothetical protein
MNSSANERTDLMSKFKSNSKYSNLMFRMLGAFWLMILLLYLTFFFLNFSRPSESIFQIDYSLKEREQKFWVGK